MILTFAGELTKMIDAGLGRESAAPDTGVAVGRYSEYVEVSDAALATFDTNAALPLRALTVNIEPIQEGTGDPSPENVRPITGRQNVTVTRAGKNLYSILIGADAFGNNVGGSHSNDNGTLVVNTTASNSSGVYATAASVLQSISKEYTGAITYSFSIKASTDVEVQIGYQGTGGGEQRLNATTNWQRITVPVTFIGTRRAFVIYTNGTAATVYVKDFQFEFGTSATEYAPPQFQTVGFGTSETIYGGVLDAVSGVLTVTHIYDRYTAVSGKSQYSAYIYTHDRIHINKLFGNVWCNYLATFRGTANTPDMPNYSITNNGGAQDVFSIRMTDDYSDAAAYNAYLAENPLDVVLMLSTPLTIQLTPQQIETLIGTNNVWSDGGNVSLTYTKYNYTEGY